MYFGIFYLSDESGNPAHNQRRCTMKAVIYRHNATLADLVKKANPDFVHEFSADMSVEDIERALQEVTRPLIKLACAPGASSDKWSVHVDGTVMAAGIYDKIWAPCNLHLIRQDNVGAYDWYAACVAEAAKRAERSKGPLVIIVRDRIADHNSETHTSACNDKDGIALMDAEHVTVHKWVERLRKHQVAVQVIAARWLQRELENVYVGAKVRDAVVICDHHNGDDLRELIEERGGIWFNAYTPCRDDDFLAT